LRGNRKIWRHTAEEDGARCGLSHSEDEKGRRRKLVSEGPSETLAIRGEILVANLKFALRRRKITARFGIYEHFIYYRNVNLVKASCPGINLLIIILG
jgi:hypothetical protein